jgi:hypothetical protein
MAMVFRGDKDLGRNAVPSSTGAKCCPGPEAETIEADFNSKLAKLQEFYDAATAPMVALYALHSPGCPHMGQFGKCDCGGLKREARLERARAALVEASGEDVA